MTTLSAPSGTSVAAPTGRSSGGHREVATVREVRRLKRIVQIGVYGAILATEPVYIFVLHNTMTQLLIGLVIGLIIATCAIEGAFSQMFKLRKRSSYPSIFLLDMGSRARPEEAARTALVAVRDLLGGSGSFVASIKGDDMQIDACDGMTEQTASELLEDPRVDDAMSGPLPVYVRSKARCVIYVPVVAWQKPVGLLGIVASRCTGELNDKELLSSIGQAIGLSLEDLRQRQDLQESLSLLSTTLDSTGDGILVMSNDSRLVNFNQQFKQIWRIPDEMLVDGSSGERILEFATSQVADPEEFLRHTRNVVAEGMAEGYDTIHFKDGRVFERYHQPYRHNGQVMGRVWSFRDITDRKQSEETIRHLAYHDALTDLPNRALFADRLTVALAQARRNGQGLAVMFLDIDRFKLINDTLGHSGGDELLRSLAVELAQLVRQGDTVARVGGDEFTLLLTGVTSREDVEYVARRALDTVRRPHVISGQEVRVSTSIGMAFFPRDGSDVETLLRNADTAMYRAKQQGRDNFQLYTPAMSAEILDRVALETELRRAINAREFVVHYQPQVEAATGRITGAEALIRWAHPAHGLIYPDQFIGVAEETGLIIPIGDWVIHEASRQNREWQDRGLPPLTVTVNLAARQFQQPNLAEGIANIVADTGLEPAWLELEITEGTTIQDPNYAASVLQELRDMGIQIAMDDFGTGYSSLNYLKRFRLDRLKIDRSFIADMIDDEHDAAITTAMILMGHSLGLTIVAEGIETPEQLEFLLEQGCDHLQGFLLGKPMPATEFEKLLEAGGVIDLQRDIDEPHQLKRPV
ncbi:MAG TPA: EAL domain-containing protein [Dehalococcoidia bacterium]|nr:EAL domain-containing protein [Dehalococcoidia bacterium]